MSNNNPIISDAKKQLLLCNQYFNHGFRPGDLKNEIFIANEFRATSNLYNEKRQSIAVGCSFRALQESFKAIAIYLLGINRKADIQRVVNEGLMRKKCNSEESDEFIRHYFFDCVGATVKILWEDVGQEGQQLILCFMQKFFHAVTCNFSKHRLTEWSFEKQQMLSNFSLWAYEVPEIVETLKKRCEIFDFDSVEARDVIPNVQEIINQADSFDYPTSFSEWAWIRSECIVYKNYPLMFFFVDALYILANYINRSADVLTAFKGEDEP